MINDDVFVYTDVHCTLIILLIHSHIFILNYFVYGKSNLSYYTVNFHNTLS